jgi:hypothetical protein
MMRHRYNKVAVKTLNDQKLVAYKSLTDNVLHCREFIQTIGPGSAMTLREAALRVEVVP